MRYTPGVDRRDGAMSATAPVVAERLSAGGIELELVRRGAGRPVLLLHGPQNVDPRARFLDLLGRRAEILAPSHPGFGHSPRPADFETVYDLVRLYLDVLEALPHEKVTLVGLSFGGWLAAEIAVTCCHRIDRLVLVDALGIKISDRETPDILDVFNTSPPEVQRRSWHDPETWAPDFNTMSDDRAGRPRPELGRAVPLRLASLHARPPAEALAPPDHRSHTRALGRQRRDRDAVLR